MRKKLEKMPTKKLIAIALSYKIEGVYEKDRERLIEEIDALSIKTPLVDKDGKPLVLPW